MNNHTPGPWQLKRSGTITDKATGELVATTGYRVVAGSDEDDANARLIAAAPALLDGCRAMVGLVQLICRNDATSAATKDALQASHRLQEAMDAIAAATGSQS